MKKVALVMGSDSDLPTVRKAKEVLDQFGIESTLHVYSAHRTPGEALNFAKEAEKNNYAVIIAFAGMAAHLAGVLAANTVLPVIGVPCESQGLGGLDALLSTVQMPSGIAVATVGIGNGKNAALLAVQILALASQELNLKLKDYREEQKNAVLAKNKDLN